MALLTTTPFELTSTAVKKTPDNKYPASDEAFLLPHEALRRELARGRKAMEHLDPVAHPWKAHYVNKWLEEFLLPAIHEHHELEEKVVAPELKKLSINVPDALNTSHVELVRAIENIGKVARELPQLVASGTATPESVKEKAEALKAEYAKLHEDMLPHLEEEEKFYSAEIQKMEVPAWKAIEHKCFAEVQKQKTGTLLFLACLNAAGYVFDGYPNGDGDTRWLADEQIQTTMLAPKPFFVRALILPYANRQYQHYKAMINAVQGDKDFLQLGEKGETKCVIL